MSYIVGDVQFVELYTITEHGWLDVNSIFVFDIVSVPLAMLVQTSLELYRSSMVLAGSYLQRVYTDLYSGQP